MFAARRIPYAQTGSFSEIVLDYLNGSEKLRPFYPAAPTMEGIRQTILKKQKQGVDRRLLAEVLDGQYQNTPMSDKVRKNLELLRSDDSFTVCTAHQPNLFTGPLYFIYKILHTISLADHLKKQLPEYHFIPVYYMGSEDADFAELNHTYVEGKKIEWQKQQAGAVGRMTVDRSLLQLIDELESQLYAAPMGKEVIGMLRGCYTGERTIQDATFELVNKLYGEYGLVILIPDHPSLKASMKKVFEDDLFRNIPSSIVKRTSEKLGEYYSVQAHPREINLFYLSEGLRERIEKIDSGYAVLNSDRSFTSESLQEELDNHPERFSPNVILRGLYQETILPNLAFIGGGGEMAYWLQLKELFEHYGIVFPVLVLRNSFLIIEEKWKEQMEKLGLDEKEIFLSENEIMNILVAKLSDKPISLNGNFEKAEALFEQIKIQAHAVDPSLSQHVAAIKTRSLKYLQELEKKMLRAEKKNFLAQQAQVQKLKSTLFPKNGLQERVENFSGFYAKWGKTFIDELYRNSLAMEQEFTVLTESTAGQKAGGI